MTAGTNARKGSRMAAKESTPTPSAAPAQGSGPVALKQPAAPSVPAIDPAREKAIELALGAIEKQFGKGSIMRLGKDPIEKEVQVIPTGSLGLDIALGIGGLPRGRIIEIYGPESSGKTTLTLHA